MKRKKAVILLGIAALAGLSLTYGHTALISLRLRSDLASSQAVRLETFDSIVIQKRVLDAAEAQEVLRAFPVVAQFPVPFHVRLCFIPHHRIVVVASGGPQVEYEICFHCDQYMFPGTGVRDMPSGWTTTTRRLFERFGLPLDIEGAENYLMTFASKDGKTVATGTIALAKALPKDGAVRAQYRLHAAPPASSDEASARFHELFRDRREGEFVWKIHASPADPAAQVLDFMPGLAHENVFARAPLLEDGKARGEWFYAIFAGGHSGGTFEIQRE